MSTSKCMITSSATEFLIWIKARLTMQLQGAGGEGEAGELTDQEAESEGGAGAEAAVDVFDLAARAEEAKRIVRGEQFYEADKLEWALNTFREVMQYISAAYYPASLVFYPMESNLGYRPGVSKEVFACLDDEQVNIYRDICNQLVLPAVAQGAAGRGRRLDRHADAADRGTHVLQDDQGDVPAHPCGGRRQCHHAVAGRVAEAGTILHRGLRLGDHL